MLPDRQERTAAAGLSAISQYSCVESKEQWTYRLMDGKIYVLGVSARRQGYTVPGADIGVTHLIHTEANSFKYSSYNCACLQYCMHVEYLRYLW